MNNLHLAVQFFLQFYYPIEVWAEAGLDTPEAAVQTFLAAMLHPVKRPFKI